MADTLLHLTLARHFTEQASISPGIKTLATRHMDDYLIGSIAVDLPYYDTLLYTGIQTLRHRPIVYHPFGQRIHEHHCRDTCARALQQANNDPSRAFALGLLTHFAVDIVFHREIERRVHNAGISHDQLERQIGLRCHHELLGHSGVGTAYALQSAMLFPDPNWREVFSSILAGIYRDAPTPLVLKKWQRSFRSFGLLYSKPWFPWLTVETAMNPALDVLSVDLIAETTDKAVSFLLAAQSFISGQSSIASFREFLPALRMSDGLPEQTEIPVSAL